MSVLHGFGWCLGPAPKVIDTMPLKLCETQNGAAEGSIDGDEARQAESAFKSHLTFLSTMYLSSSLRLGGDTTCVGSHSSYLIIITLWNSKGCLDSKKCRLILPIVKPNLKIVLVKFLVIGLSMAYMKLQSLSSGQGFFWTDHYINQYQPELKLDVVAECTISFNSWIEIYERKARGGGEGGPRDGPIEATWAYKPLWGTFLWISIGIFHL